MDAFIDILINFGGGKGGEASGTVVRFLLPTFFWLILSYISGKEWQRTDKNRDLFIAIAALAGTFRELIMFFAEYGSGRSYFNFDIFYRYYPPLEHA
ncbi:MAG: PAS domain-containing sensor histidine kinase, partial [Desulfuromonadaceae bacterium]|nr:PAS domain-containing sensor histidine kinase [Desulfuromonadaceae bacterium]